VGGHRHGQEVALEMFSEAFLCISVYSKTLSRRIIYALLSQPVVGFWGLRLQTPSGVPPLEPAGDFRPQTHNLSTPEKNPAGAHGYILVMRRFIHFITFPSEVTLIVIQRLIISQVPRILHTTSASGEFITPATWNLAHLRSFMFSCVIKVYQPVYRHLQRQCAIVEQVRYSGQVQ